MNTTGVTGPSQPVDASRVRSEHDGGFRKAAVLGAGSWGTTFAKVLVDAAWDEERRRRDASAGPSPEAVDALQGTAESVVLWGRNADDMTRTARTRVNQKYVPGLHLPDPLEITADLGEALDGADLVVLALPAQTLRGKLPAIAEHLNPDAALVSLAKGLEQGTGLRMTEVVAKVLAEHRPEADGGHDAAGWFARTCVLSGPNLAMEIADEQPTASVVAARDPELAAAVARACAAPYFRPYTNTDVVGTEIAGLTKNVIAVIVGICEGRHYGDNSKASIITRGLAESTRLAMALGGKPETMSGLAGIGDLVATCSSPLSRNHTAGRLFGQGKTLDEIHREMTQTAEGLKSAPAVLALARAHGVDMPITQAVVAILEGRITVENLAPLLLGRQLKSEATPS
ncbi:NAD(P)-dependent glycerol-3-phosphate dehydrogenase [Kocuria soli]|uniref:Glycerol-3-phosphate dehydrogenase [NAD(P)+] n=1 Tax=Kocuria soli TaxID=2485125 RepID=A0A3N3ZPL2_9MICC|nr:NAD(P)H-dependent glycerol-3-phosphate dehydrogenase [Kocuria soli]ROZ62973.1 NAD(P)-dependent glycerol-3-phosphate dehydrogenase [Kocuria soli]